MRITSKARELRNNLTQSEAIVWEAVRNRKTGYKIVRQKPILLRINGADIQYFADFYCHEKRVIIEIDGNVHENRVDHDLIRDDLTTKAGYRVIRIINDEVELSSDWLLKLRKFLDATPSPLVERGPGGEGQE